MNVLGVESSCDETSVSVTRDGTTVLSNVVFSQIDTHKAFGGVVPEVASREHIKRITVVFEEALKQAGVKAEDIDLVAVTKGPGLIGSLLVGINGAKAFAFAHDIPIIGVHHIAGHIYANQIEDTMEFPLVALVVSGGHTELILMKEHYEFEKLGETQDDAVGEAYDKTARVLGLGYPGGPIIDKLAKEANPTYPMPVIRTEGAYDFSYSGLKSHVINMVNTMRMKGESIDEKALAASFQEAAVAHLIDKSLKAVEDTGAKMFIVAGGVSANRHLRAEVEKHFKHVKTAVPPFAYCTDNAAMMGIAGYYQFQKRKPTESMRINGHSRLTLE
ncbi:MAG: tRNA (adenosine(37)-N6)-threonylcarbamoyltransferase complex transferase subunit TsaD [Candidatus Izemoplasmataceae bacterium]